jgi:hypothetical protein
MSTQPEQFYVAVTALQPIGIEDPEHELIEAVEAARLLGVSKPAISQYMDRGTLSTIRRSGSSRRWLLRSEVMALAALKGAAVTEE